jgi:hypothetical protein
MRSFLVLVLILGTSQAFARASGGGGGLDGSWSLGLYGGIQNASQDGLNELQSRANTREGGITTSALNQAWEVAPALTYRYSGTIYAVQLRPSYFYERQDGHAASGSFTYGVTGFTIFPILRLYPLENDFMKFYMQFGLGYGQVHGMVNEGLSSGTDRHVEFGSGAFGSLIGMGAEFQMTDSQSLAFEVDYRYLDFIRNVASSSTGTGFGSGSLSQSGKGQEVELAGNDLDIKMSGLMFMAGYIFYF